ncbi:MAG: ABC transporter ATP-binding protein [Acetobacteraceae bacterium]|nr:ABC transporter ATP-binding protein [Acetobacteraceae bacterium]
MPPTPTAPDAAAVADAVPPLLRVEDLRVSFGLAEGTVRAVDGVDFEVPPAEVLGVVGESGCGKSVTIRAILRLVSRPGRMDGGSILFRKADGSVIDLATLPARGALMRAMRGAEIALIPQEPMASFSPVHTVGAQIAEAIRLHDPSVGRAAARDITIGLFRDVGISMPERRVDAYSWQLSGGLRQRAMIAMALSCRPRLLIADEPTTAIDVTTQAQILALLRQLQHRHRTAIVFITHDLGVIARMASRVVVMYLGRVVEQGPVDAIFHNPLHPYTRALLRSIPSLAGAVRTKLPVIAGALPHPFNRPSGCAFHPRCPDAMAKCARAVPALEDQGGGQRTACFLYDRAAGR